MTKIEFKEDGSQWYSYFSIRLDGQKRYEQGAGYYISWRGVKRIAVPNTWFSDSSGAREWFKENDWRKIVDTEFEKEVLGDSYNS